LFWFWDEEVEDAQVHGGAQVVGVGHKHILDALQQQQQQPSQASACTPTQAPAVQGKDQRVITLASNGASGT